MSKVNANKNATYEKAIECAYSLYNYFINDISFTEFEVNFLNGKITQQIVNLLNKRYK